jgi:hypothetical protein
VLVWLATVDLIVALIVFGRLCVPPRGSVVVHPKAAEDCRTPHLTSHFEHPASYRFPSRLKVGKHKAQGFSPVFMSSKSCGL